MPDLNKVQLSRYHRVRVEDVFGGNGVQGDGSGGSGLFFDDWGYDNPYHVYSFAKHVFAYSGPCIELYRISDGTTQDIGFDDTNSLDTDAAETFLDNGGGPGSSDGYIRRWYDQMEHEDINQTLFTSMPMIYDSTTGWKNSGAYLAAEFDGVNDFLAPVTSSVGLSLINGSSGAFGVYTSGKFTDGVLVSADAGGNVVANPAVPRNALASNNQYASLENFGWEVVQGQAIATPTRYSHSFEKRSDGDLAIYQEYDIYPTRKTVTSASSGFGGHTVTNQEVGFYFNFSSPTGFLDGLVECLYIWERKAVSDGNIGARDSVHTHLHQISNVEATTP